MDHRFTTFDELYTFATDAKKAGVSALMLVQIQKTEACPGPWYNGLQLCDHINGSCKCRGRLCLRLLKVRSLKEGVLQIPPWTALSRSGKRW